MTQRDISILKHMMKYTNEIQLAKDHFGNDKESFNNNVLYRNTVAMSLLQIGELSGHLSETFKTAFSDDINWRGLKSFRNICAHNYLGIDIDIVWNELTVFLPKFTVFCELALQNASKYGSENTEDEEELEI